MSGCRKAVSWLPWAAVACCVAAASADEPPVDFDRDIRPILSDHCFQCHGPDPKPRQAELRLDQRADAFEERDGYRLVVPGKRGQSVLFERITSGDPDERMPPPDHGRPLTAKQIELIGRWIDAGAKWQDHWAFRQVARPALPQVKTPAWCRNEIDYFILDRIERAGLRPAAEADKTTLLRRATLDATGLPPTPRDVAALRADTHPDAYERVVDRLLHSPRYGEEMARRWLDAARYADTSGYQTDGVRHMWRWRDWVIDSFNRNQPFDQFTVEQLAGDLLPNPTLDQLIATGFHRNHRANSEGGIVFEEYLVEYAVDRVETTFTVWMGLTMGCARCHDHKYDPLTQNEFYGAVAYFNNIPERGRVIKYGNSAPMIKAPTRLQLARIRQLRGARKDAAAKLSSQRKTIQVEQSQWEQRLADLPAIAGALDDLVAGELTLDDPATARVLDSDEPAESKDAKPAVPAAVPAAEPADAPTAPTDENLTFADGRVDKAAVFDGQTSLLAGKLAEFSGADRFSLGLWFRPALDDQQESGARPDANGTLAAWMDPEDSRAKGFSVELHDGRIRVNFGPRWLDDAIRLETLKAVAADRWHHLMVVYDGTQMARGLKIYVNGREQPTKVLLDIFTGTFKVPYPVRLGDRGDGRHPYRGALDALRFFKRALSPAEVGIEACPETLQQIAKLPVAERQPGQYRKLQRHFLVHAASPPLRKAFQEIRSLDLQLEQLNDQVPTTMIMRDRPRPRKTFVLNRGQYDQPGREVAAGVPACLPPLPQTAPANRLALAQWLVDPRHPLTSRVAVNRLWQQHFGFGLVGTTEDFGSQGERPSHPRLLDWLAAELIESGWDVKHIERLILTSATYRQSSTYNEAAANRDPDNRLLARAPRLRLPAEVIRDGALAVAGLLVDTIGGPSVKPYQPDGLWKEIASDTYQRDAGRNLYRRSMYTFWKRTVPPPMMATFDATARETCSVRRSRTNTPLQALALMNDETFVEAARGMATRMLQEGGATPGERLAWGFQLVTGRAVGTAERVILERNLQRGLLRFKNEPAAARALLAVGESRPPAPLDPVQLAAYTTTANLMLNLDEVVMRE